MGILRRGRGRPLTLFAPGGDGDHLAERMRYADRIAGTKLGFAYEQSGHFDSVAHIRRRAERDAGEVVALAEAHGIDRAVGFSRGARAIVGALAERPTVFRRVALVIPPGGTARGKYLPWMESLPGSDRAALAAEVVVIAHSGERDHPADVAEAWAQCLGARLELLERRGVYEDVERVQELLADFFD
jgi:pimeloyl-ACP methyl ester carboxylesterase